MTTWLIIFGLGLMGCILAHGLRQHRMTTKAPSLRAQESKHDENIHPVRQESALANTDHAITPRQLAIAQHCFGADGPTPWMFRLEFTSQPQWSKVARVLARHGLVYDGERGAYHAFTGDGLHYSIVAGGNWCEQGLPSPTDRARINEDIEVLWLILPPTHSVDALTAFESLIDLSSAFTKKGNVLKDAQGYLLDEDGLSAWHDFFHREAYPALA